MLVRASIAVLVAGVLVVLGIALLSNSDPTKSHYTSVGQVMPDLTGASPQLVKIGDQANELVAGGVPAYDARIKSLRGHGIVVNKWASWCGPCRSEFPVFQKVAKKLGGTVAFLGVNVADNDESAKQFLGQQPVPYPSYIDGELKISKQFPPAKYAPITNFYDPDGKLTQVHAGPFNSAAELESDIAKYTAAN